MKLPFQAKTKASLPDVLVVLLILSTGSSPAQNVASPSATPKPKAASPAAEWVGHYYLKGQMEMGSELLLRADGSFAWMISYGAVDQQAQGRWTLKDQAISLTSAKPSKAPTFRLFEEDECTFASLPPKALGSPSSASRRSAQPPIWRCFSKLAPARQPKP